MIALFILGFRDGWDKYYLKMDNTEKERIWKKIQELKTREKERHLKHGLPFFVLESGQYRICFEEKGDIRKITFAGNHKQYGKWTKKH